MWRHNKYGRVVEVGAVGQLERGVVTVAWRQRLAKVLDRWSFPLLARSGRVCSGRALASSDLKLPRLQLLLSVLTTHLERRFATLRERQTRCSGWRRGEGSRRAAGTALLQRIPKESALVIWVKREQRMNM